MNITPLRAASLIILLMTAAAYIYTNNQEALYKNTALPATHKIISDITLWQQEPLLKHLSAQTRETLNDNQIQRLLEQYRKFGTLESVDELHFSRLVNLLSFFGQKKINYSGSIHFSTGKAHLNLTLLEDKATNTFTVYNLNIHKQ